MLKIPWRNTQNHHGSFTGSDGDYSKNFISKLCHCVAVPVCSLCAERRHGWLIRSWGSWGQLYLHSVYRVQRIAEWNQAACPCTFGEPLESLTEDFVCWEKCRCEQSTNWIVWKCEHSLWTSIKVTWKLLVAIVDGNIPCSWNSCMTSCRRCSKIFLWPFSLASFTAADLCDGVFGVRGDLSELSSAARTALTQSNRIKIMNFIHI